MGKLYDFMAQNIIGLAAEKTLDDFFAEWYHVERVSDALQREGIDRIFSPHSGVTQPFTVEYKADFQAYRTGNAFVEIETNDKGPDSGWAYTSTATMLIYYVPGSGADIAYAMPFEKLRQHLPRWRRHFREASISNVNYHTAGILVPLEQFERFALAHSL